MGAAPAAVVARELLMMAPAKPEGTGKGMVANIADDRKRLFERGEPAMHQVIHCADDLEFIVERKECLEQILLVPKTPLVRQPLGRKSRGEKMSWT